MSTCLGLSPFSSKVQKTASSAVRWSKKQGGNPAEDDLVKKLSGIATKGKCLQNAERDLHRLLHRESLSFNAEPEYVMVRMVDPSTLEIDWSPLAVLFPDTLLKALWALGEDVFRHCLFGDLTENDTLEIWQHIENTCDWFSSHPARHWHSKGKLASLGTYGDEVQCYKNSECGVVSVSAWCAEFCTNSHPLCRYYPIAIWSEHVECEWTFGDMESQMIQRWRSLCDPEVAWPWTQSGYLMAFTFAQGDLKWLNERMGGLHNYRRNDFCSRCHCLKTDPDLTKTLPNFSEDPDAHEERAWSQEELAGFSPLLTLPGMCMQRVMHDVVHSQYLGTGKATNGSWHWLIVIFLFARVTSSFHPFYKSFPAVVI